MSGFSHTDPEAVPLLDERYRLLFDRNPQPMWVYDVDTLGFMAVNDAAVTHYGYSRSEFLAMTIRDIRPEEDVSALERVAQNPAPLRRVGTWRHRKKDGTFIDVEVLTDDLPFAGRRCKLVVATDVTASRRAKLALEQRAAEQAAVGRLGARALEGGSVSELIDAAVSLVAAVLDVELTELLEHAENRDSLLLRAGVGWAPGLVRQAQVPGGSSFHPGFTSGSLGHVVVEDFANERRFAATPLQRKHRIASGVSVIVGRKARPFGVLGAYATAPRSFGADEVNFLKAVANVLALALDRARSDERIRHQALHDALTGLPNRTLLLERLNHWLDRTKRAEDRAAVLFVDFDHFKLVNDALGHQVGDELLRAAADRMRATLRPSDTVARVGGDEFVLLCEDLPWEAAALELVERLTEALEAPFELCGHQRFLTASIGISLATGSEDPEALLRDADAAMYRAKERGRARFELFDEGMHERSRRWLEIESDLRRALTRGELHNVYQPMVDTRGRVVGFEALVRWQHPTRGPVAPAEFIPVADESGLVVALGRDVLRAACEQAVTWPAHLHVSVNLSARQVSHSGLADCVAHILADTGLDGDRLNLELTETVLINDTDHALETLRELKALGVGLVLDDFGTGYSSLAYLKRFPIDTIKIDRSFVDGLARDPEDEAIVGAVISMGHALNVRVVAEGVETAAQADRLQTLGCELAQGFLFGRPVTAEELAERLASERTPALSS